MNLRLALLKVAAVRGLSAADTGRLQQLAALDAEPAALPTLVPRTIAVIAAALGGFGLILWIAANWESFGRFGRFGLLEAVVAVIGVTAWQRPALRAPLALLTFLGIGALFACFGQTYQTGADPWQLFFVWALLGLPLCLGTRSDVLWAPWALVVLTAVSLWALSQRGTFDFGRGDHLVTDLTAWFIALALVVGLSPAFTRFTGAGVWAMRTAVTLAIVPIGFSALGSLFGSGPTYLIGLLVLAGAAVLLSLPRTFDIFALSIIALAIDVLLICGIGHVLVDGLNSDVIGSMLPMTLVAVGVLTASVKGVMFLSRHHAAAGVHGGAR